MASDTREIRVQFGEREMISYCFTSARVNRKHEMRM